MIQSVVLVVVVVADGSRELEPEVEVEVDELERFAFLVDLKSVWRWRAVNGPGWFVVVAAVVELRLSRLRRLQMKKHYSL